MYPASIPAITKLPSSLNGCGAIAPRRAPAEIPMSVRLSDSGWATAPVAVQTTSTEAERTLEQMRVMADLPGRTDRLSSTRHLPRRSRR